MQSEEFDKKIQQAADHHHPTYDEQAWAKMEMLLNKHLPQKKDDRRRIIFFLLLFLLLGGAATFLFINKSQQPKQSLANRPGLLQQNNSINKPTNTTPDKVEQATSPIFSEKSSKGADTKKELIQSFSPKKIIVFSDEKLYEKAKSKNIPPNNTSAIISNIQEAATSKPPVSKIDKQIIKNDPVGELSAKNNTSNIAVPENNIVEKNVIITNEQPPVVSSNISKTEDSNKNAEPANVITADKNKKNRSKKSNSFFISVSASPDVSGAGGESTGKMKMTTGAGLGYTFGNKFTLRTGFYTSRKVYTASPGEYHPPASFWNYYPNLEKVDADCRVYEIPLLLSYHFGKSLKQNWSATAGLSSYLMKRETYNYTYKNQWGQSQFKSWTIYDQNKHYFSVLTLSGGYKRNISNSFFIAAEPYLKLPLSGLGYGKIKLNSAGIQFSLGATLFSTTKKAGLSSH